jgi:hypothetical protein
MGTWISDNWWWVWSLVAGLAWVAYLVHRRGGDEPLPLRIVYVFVPLLDRQSEVRRGMSPRTLATIAVAMIIFLIIFVVIDNRD